MNAISRFTSAITSGPIPSPGSSKSLWVAIGVVLKHNAGRSLKRWTQDLQAAHAFRRRHSRQGRLFAGLRAGASPTRTVCRAAWPGVADPPWCRRYGVRSPGGTKGTVLDVRLSMLEAVRCTGPISHVEDQFGQLFRRFPIGAG